jgi:hypothetical protein
MLTDGFVGRGDAGLEFRSLGECDYWTLGAGGRR